MKKIHRFSFDSSWIEVVSTLAIAIFFAFVLPPHAITLFFFLFWPFLQLFWMMFVVKEQLALHHLGKAILLVFANLFSLGILMLSPIIVFNYLPKTEDPVMDENEAKQFDIYVASYSCTDNVILDSIRLDIECWTQYSNRYVNYQSKEDIDVTPRFICYSCKIGNDEFYQKMCQNEYSLDWRGYCRKDASSENFVFAEHGVAAKDVKDTIALYIWNNIDPNQVADSLTFVRITQPHIPDWDISKETERRHVECTWWQNFLSRIYYDYFWRELFQ